MKGWQQKVLLVAVRMALFLSPVYDLLRLPRVFDLIWRRLVRTRPLTLQEREAAAKVLGPNAVDWNRVRVAQGGILDRVWKNNGGRAFATFYTINVPPHEGLPIVVHELAHICQFEQVGTRYMWEALYSQLTQGGLNAYGYEGPDGLVKVREKKGLKKFNREQQAQIVQDYFERVVQAEAENRPPQVTDEQRQAYEHFIDQFRSGRV